MEGTWWHLWIKKILLIWSWEELTVWSCAWLVDAMMIMSKIQCQAVTIVETQQHIPCLDHGMLPWFDVWNTINRHLLCLIIKQYPMLPNFVTFDWITSKICAVAAKETAATRAVLAPCRLHSKASCRTGTCRNPNLPTIFIQERTWTRFVWSSLQTFLRKKKLQTKMSEEGSLDIFQICSVKIKLQIIAYLIAWKIQTKLHT
jgi:hypothetical protein